MTLVCSTSNRRSAINKWVMATFLIASTADPGRPIDGLPDMYNRAFAQPSGVFNHFLTARPILPGPRPWSTSPTVGETIAG